jgi:hypothetical protein
MMSLTSISLTTILPSPVYLVTAINRFTKALLKPPVVLFGSPRQALEAMLCVSSCDLRHAALLSPVPLQKYKGLSGKNQADIPGRSGRQAIGANDIMRKTDILHEIKGLALAKADLFCICHYTPDTDHTPHAATKDENRRGSHNEKVSRFHSDNGHGLRSRSRLSGGAAERGGLSAAGQGADPAQIRG